jgi:hypothetical protein
VIDVEVSRCAVALRLLRSGARGAVGPAARGALALLVLALFVLACSAQAHAQQAVNYEPPSVDFVYPADAGADLGGADGGAPGEPRPNGGDGAAATAPMTSSGDAGTALPTAPTAQAADAATAWPLAHGDAGDGSVPARELSTAAPLPDAAASGATNDSAVPPPLPPVSDDGEDDYGAQATVRRAPAAGTREVTMESARDLPGAFGDPLRILEALPGVVPVASGVPYSYVRGSPPASQGYVYDDIPLPQLFHAAFGPAVIHPRATGPMSFNAGVPSARYGRRTGGLLLARGVPHSRTFDAEVELRLIDFGAWAQGSIGKGQAMVSGRLGYPKLALLAAESLGAVKEGTKLNYWDGQVRYLYPLTTRDHVELIWLGSFDDIALPGVNTLQETGTTRLHFHRVETRFVHRVQRGTFGTALRFGFDQSELGTALAVKAFSFGPRFWSDLKFGRHRLRLGGDLFVSQGDVVNKPGGTLGSPDGDLKISLPKIAEAPARNQGGLHAETELRAGARTRFTLGARLDYWSVRSKVDFAVDPRLRATFDWTEKLELHAAFGMAHQPAVFFLPLPGLTDVALDRGLSSSIQNEIGAAYQLPASVRLEVQAFVHKYKGLLLPELVMDASIEDDPPLSDALAYGLELFLKRDLNGVVSGWISYTLGWAYADSESSIGRFRPDFDVRHVLNTVLRWRIHGGFVLGGRLHARSGRVIEQLNPSYEQRLPWFVRADVRFGYGWHGRFAEMVAYLEWLNVAAQGEYLDADCLFECQATRAPPISIPNVGLRADF